jgi:glutathione synthase/RimK-type ligase-like ATP-grasp enzyme
MYRENTADIAGIALPVIIRPVGSHAGHDLQKVNSAQEAADYCESVRASQFYVAPFIDYRSSDGLYRKYRVMIIQGHAYICHMAISSHWMIHYLNAGMTESEAKRREEARAMENFDNDFAKRHNAALQAITQRVGLDYFGLDCAETQDGKLVIFEVDSNMIVHDMDPIDTFAYKQPVMQKLFAAFRSMLLDAALGKKRGV